MPGTSSAGYLNFLPPVYTSVFGNVLKIDSTKKVCKKLQGTAAGSASWCTNVGNERGEVLILILTESEGMEGLHPMAKGLIGRFVCVSSIKPVARNFYWGVLLDKIWTFLAK